LPPRSQPTMRATARSSATPASRRIRSQRTSMSVSERTSRYGGMLLVAAVTLIGTSAARANEQIHVGKAQGTAWTFLPVDIGIEQGFFAKLGLDIDSADLGGDAKVQQALA